MVGNRDFLVGAELLAACGMPRLADPTVLVAFGERMLLSHGDALCLADTEYQQFRRRCAAPTGSPISSRSRLPSARLRARRDARRKRAAQARAAGTLAATSTWPLPLALAAARRRADT